MKRFVFLAAIAPLLATPRVVSAQAAQLIDLQADRIEIQDKAQRAIFSGNVRAKQGDMTITAETATVKYSGQTLSGAGNPEIERIDARGNVVVTRPSETARGNYAIYDFSKRIVTMVGSVTLRKQGNVVNGERLSLNLNTDRAVMNGGPVGSTSAASGGRVTGTFTVPKRSQAE